jgi:hypothetical protein
MSMPKVYLDHCIEVPGNDRVGRFLCRLWKWQARTPYATVAACRGPMPSGPRAEPDLHAVQVHDREGDGEESSCASSTSGARTCCSSRSRTAPLSLTLLPDQRRAKVPNSERWAKVPNSYKNPIKEPGERTSRGYGFAAANPETICLSGKKSHSKRSGTITSRMPKEGRT